MSSGQKNKKQWPLRRRSSILLALFALALGSTIHFVHTLRASIQHDSELRYGPTEQRPAFIYQLAHAVEHFVIFRGKTIHGEDELLFWKIIDWFFKNERYIIREKYLDNTIWVPQKNLVYKKLKCRKKHTDVVVLAFNPNMHSIEQGDYPYFLPLGVDEFADIYWPERPGYAGNRDFHIYDDAQSKRNSLAFYQHLKDMGVLEGKTIIVYGYSLGGSDVYLLGANHHEIAAAITVSTFSDIQQIFADVWGPWFGHWFNRQERFMLNSKVHAAHLRCDLLVVHGGADELIGPEHAARLLAARSGNQYEGECRYHEVPGADHLGVVNFVRSKEGSELILSFMFEAIKKDRAKKRAARAQQKEKRQKNRAQTQK